MNKGIFLGRFQPFHLAHQYTVEQIIADGKQPTIFVGSSQEQGTAKNPYHVQDRINMIKLVYPNIKVYAIEDKDNWDDWMSIFMFNLETLGLLDSTIYTHNKPKDRMDFTYKGKQYTNEFYSKLYEIEGLTVKDLPLSGIDLHATDIRANLTNNKHNLHPKVYDYIKGL